MQCRALEQKRYFRSRASWCRKSMYGGCRFVQTCCALRSSHFRRFPAIAWTVCRPGATTISASCTWRPHRDCHKWWTIIRSDSYSTLIEGEEGRDMENFDANSLRILELIEDEFRNHTGSFAILGAPTGGRSTVLGCLEISCTCSEFRNGRCSRLGIACGCGSVNAVLKMNAVVMRSA